MLSKNIRALRESLGYTQEQIATYLNITAPAVSQYESDARSIPAEAISKIALLFNVEEYELYQDDPHQQQRGARTPLRRCRRGPGPRDQPDRLPCLADESGTVPGLRPDQPVRRRRPIPGGDPLCRGQPGCRAHAGLFGSRTARDDDPAGAGALDGRPHPDRLRRRANAAHQLCAKALAERRLCP